MSSRSSRDIFDLLEPIIRGHPSVNPWIVHDDGTPTYRPDLGLLIQMLAVQAAESSIAQSGRLAKTIDAWVASELRRAGFGEDEVWPRLVSPRVLPREVGLLVSALPPRLRADVQTHLTRNRQVGPADARVLGRAYVKQVDVLIAQWSRGPELLISTKSMASSFRKNLPNRFEEAYGDAKNLRGRYPLVAMGFLFVMHASVRDEPGTLDRAIDMLRKLRAENDVYDATCLLVVEWGPSVAVSVVEDVVPDDLAADSLLAVLVDAVLARTPIEMHVRARERRAHRDLPISEDGIEAV
ncbi:MAG: hypothetical protein ACRDVN_01170 [Jiangellaceae bacterium]